MDPYDEQTLREEVLYLHSLWLKGPPTQQLQQQLQPPLHLPPSFSLHGISNPHQIKKKRPRKKTRERGYLKKAKDLHFEREREWPVNPTSSSSPASVSGWAKASSESNSTTLLPSPEEQARYLANRAQLKALNAAHDFLSSDDYDDDEDDDELEVEEEEEYMDEDIDDFLEEKDGCKEYRFFYSLFMEDGGLKEYYLHNYPNGEFNCLVCGGTLKKFKDCVALVQHSNSIAKKRRAHRSYGQAICKLLGWEIDNLPKITSDLTAMVKVSSDKSPMGNAEAQETNAVLMPDAENIPNNNEATQDEHQKKESGDNGNTPDNGETMNSEGRIHIGEGGGQCPYFVQEASIETCVLDGESKDDAPGDA